MLDKLVSLVVLHKLIQSGIRLVDVGIGRPGIVLEHRRGEQLVMPREPDKVLMAGNHPHLVLTIPVDRVFLSQLSEIAVGVRDSFGGEHVFGYSGDHDASGS